MVRESLRVPLFMFRLGTSSQNLRKIAENTNVCTEKDKYSDSNIFGRYACNGSNNGRNSQVQRHCNLPPATFRFCFKPGEVHFESSSGERVPWGNNKFFEDVSVFTTREGVKNSESVSGCSYQRSGDSSRTSKIVRPSCLNNSGSFASSDEFSISSTTANKSIENNSLLSSNCIPQEQFKGGTSVVDPKSPDFQWTLPNSASIFFDNKDGCILERLGSVCQGIPTGGEWNLQEQQLHINVLKMKAVKLALLVYHKHFLMKAIHFQIDNATALTYLVKIGSCTMGSRLLQNFFHAPQTWRHNDKQGLKKDSPGPNENNVDCSSHMAVSGMVPNPSENVNRETTSFATPPTSSIKPPGSDTSINNKQNK